MIVPVSNDNTEQMVGKVVVKCQKGQLERSSTANNGS